MNDPIRAALIGSTGIQALKVKHIIIGSGVGGSMAADWCARHGEDALVIEEGPDLSELVSPYSLKGFMSGLWREGGIVPIESDARFVFAEGRTVGGSSMVNAGILHRLPEAVRAEWERAHNLSSFGAQNLDVWFSEAERMVASPPKDSVLKDAELFTEGAEKMGWKPVSPQTTVDRGVEPPKKKTMRSTYLARAVQQGARILSRATVERILFQGRKAVGVRVRLARVDGSSTMCDVSCETVTVCAGALQTPVVLQRSGIRKNIGNNLRFHPTVRATAIFPQKVEPWKDPMSALQIKGCAPERSFGISMSFPPHIASSWMPQWPATKSAIGAMDRSAIYYVMTPSHGRGTVRPFGKSSYRASYKMAKEDLVQLRQGMSQLSDLLRAAGAQETFFSIRSPQKAFQDLQPKDFYLMSIHAFSSCPMGARADCPVDSFGRLKGVENVQVQDASLLPTAPTVNPQLTIMAVVGRNLAEGTFFTN